jgi:hypothetical protein
MTILPTDGARIEGEILASKAPRINRKIAIPVKEVKADMIQRLEPHPKNWKIKISPHVVNN